MEKIRIGFVGCGQFARHFVPLFRAHPAVEYVAVCDKFRERAEDYKERFSCDEIFDTFDEMIASDRINAVAIFSQRDLHGVMAIAALKAGKHVYSAVPMALKVDEILEIVRLVGETGLTYSMGETGIYRPASIFCRRAYTSGEIGNLVYAEAQYNHDIRNMEMSFRSSGGEDWKRYAGIPPFFYPTHSTAMVLSSMPGVYAKRVTAMGYKGSPRTDIYGEGDENLYKNPFAAETMLMELSNGGIVRISENRCLGWMSPETYITQFYGSEGGYEFSVAHHHMAKWDPERPGKVIMRDVTDVLQPESITKMIRDDYDRAIQEIADTAGFHDTSPIQPTERLPEEFSGLPNGHNGTHQFLIDDFCRAYETGKLSPTNIWAVARYNIPGLMAHESALRGGEPVDVIDLGDPPSDWEVLDYRTMK